MPAPGITVNVFDLTVYNPRTTDAIMGCVGPATKGEVNQLTDITDEGTLITRFGRAGIDRMYAQRGAVRYLKRGNQLKFVRVAGTNLSYSTLTLNDENGNPILILTAASKGTWANDLLAVAVTHNGTSSYNLQVFFDGQQVEPSYRSLNNGNVVTTINNSSTRLTVELASGAGATFPAETRNAVTNALETLSFAGGNDGAFASTDSVASSSGGFAGRRFYGKMDAVSGSRVFENLLTIDSSQAGKAVLYGSVGMAVTPGSFTIQVQTAAGPTYVELADDGDESYTLGGAGLGLLIPSAGAHRGFIDYRTGNYGIQLDSATMFLAGTVDAIWVRAVTEIVGTTATGVGAYAGGLSNGPMGVGYLNSNKVAFTVPISEIVGTAPTTAATTSNVDAGAALKTLAGWVVPGTVVLTPVSVDGATVPPPIYDDGFGGFRTAPNGGGVALAASVFDYRTGAWDAGTAWDPVGAVAFPATAQRIDAEYDILVLDMGGAAVAGPNGTYTDNETVNTSVVGTPGTLANTDTNSQTIANPIEPGSARMTVTLTGLGVVEFFDNGAGAWLVKPRGDPRATLLGGTSAIDYDAGTWTLDVGTVLGDTFVALSQAVLSYTTVAGDKARRSLGGAGSQYLGAAATESIVGLAHSEPASGNSFNGSDFLDHRDGTFGFTLTLSTTPAPGTFDVKDNGSIHAVYVPADLLGFGDGTETTFTGLLAPAPFRREDDRLVGFQGAQASSAGAGDGQVTFADLGASPNADTWSDNVDAPNSSLSFGSGAAVIKWTSAPLREEAVYVVAEEAVLHATSRYPGDIGNERATITEGLYLILDADPTLADTLRMRVMFNSVAVESFGQAVNIDELVTLVNDPTNGSDFIRLDKQANADLLEADLTSSQTSGMSGAFTTADVIGAKSGNNYTGMQIFRNYEEVALDFLMIPGQWHRQVITALQELCELPGRRCIGVVSSPEAEPDPGAFQNRDFSNGELVASAKVPFPPQAVVDSSQLAFFDPWVGYFDQYSNADVIEPPEGDIAMLIAFTDDIAFPWYPIAGNRRGRVLADTVKYSTPKEDREILYGLVGNRTEVINSIIRQRGRGLALAGQRTAQRAPTSLDRLNVRWTVNRIMNQLDALSQDFLFEINDSILWREIEAAAQNLINPIVEARGLQDAFLLIDETTTTANDIDNLCVNAKLYIKPARATEFIKWDVILTPTGADFATVIAAG